MSPEPTTPTREETLHTWRKPPPHFKPDPRWQRQPQSDEEWDAHKDAPGMREFRAKRRLAFAGDLADPRTPECMALVSRLDLSVVLSRLAWLEARFENTRDTALPPVAEPIASVPVTTEAVARLISQHIRKLFGPFGEDADATGEAEDADYQLADAILALLAAST